MKSLTRLTLAATVAATLSSPNQAIYSHAEEPTCSAGKKCAPPIAKREKPSMKMSFPSEEMTKHDPQVFPSTDESPPQGQIAPAPTPTGEEGGEISFPDE